MAVTLRPTVLEDAKTLANLETRIFIDDAWPAADIEGILGVPNVFGVVAIEEDETTPLGYAMLQLAPKAVGDILTIGVVPEARQKGVATELLKHMLAVGMHHHVPNIYLEVRESNLSAQRFYEKHGAEQVGRRPGYYRAQGSLPQEDALVYQFVLEDNA